MLVNHIVRESSERLWAMAAESFCVSGGIELQVTGKSKEIVIKNNVNQIWFLKTPSSEPKIKRAVHGQMGDLNRRFAITINHWAALSSIEIEAFRLLTSPACYYEIVIYRLWWRLRQSLPRYYRERCYKMHLACSIYQPSFASRCCILITSSIITSNNGF